MKPYITARQNANNCSSLPTTPEKSTSSCAISKKQTLPSNSNIIDFHIYNSLKNSIFQRVHSLVVSDLRSETKGSARARWLCAKVNPLQ